jgi:hypothetical protein
MIPTAISVVSCSGRSFLKAYASVSNAGTATKTAIQSNKKTIVQMRKPHVGIDPIECSANPKIRS